MQGLPRTMAKMAVATTTTNGLLSSTDKAKLDSISGEGDQTITLTGDVTGSGAGSFATAIGSNKVTLDMMAQVSTARLLGRTTASTGNVESLTAAQATALLNTFASGLKGLAPASGGGTTNYLRADGTWAAPAGGGGGSVTPAAAMADIEMLDGDTPPGDGMDASTLASINYMATYFNELLAKLRTAGLMEP